MNPRVRILTIFVAALSCVVVGLALFPLDNTAMPDFVRFLARLHPMTVHLPIGVFAALLVLELVGRRQGAPNLAPACMILLWLLVVTGVPTAILGILLAPSGSYEDELLFRHRWLGCATAVLAMWMLVLRNLHVSNDTRSFLAAYRVLLLILAVVVIAAGHYGGTLTHGAGYLTRYAPGFLRSEQSDREDASVRVVPQDIEPVDPYVQTVQPILENYCYRCHGEEEQKGDIRQDILDPDLKGGPDVETWSMVLDMLSAHEMPPENKPQPSDLERQAVVQWLTESLVVTGASVP